MRKSFVALLAAGALVATGPVLAQSRAADMPARSGAPMEDASELRGGFIIPTVAIVGVILLILAFRKFPEIGRIEDEAAGKPVPAP